MWDKDTELFMNEYRSGKIDGMKKDLESLLLPFDHAHLRKIEDDWQVMKSHEEKAQWYLGVALRAGREVGSESFLQATEDVMYISKRLGAKRDFARDRLDKALLEYQSEFAKRFEENDKQSLQESKEELRVIRDLARAVEYDDACEQTFEWEMLCDKGINHLLKEENRRKEQELLYDSIVKQAKDLLANGTSTKELEDMRQHLNEVCEGDDLRDEYFDHLREFNSLRERYDKVIKERYSKNNRRAWKSAFIAAGAAALLGAGYLGVGWLRGTHDRMHDRVKERQEEVIDSLEVVKESYAADIVSLQAERAIIDEEVRRKREESGVLDERSVAAEVSPLAASVVPLKDDRISNDDFDVVDHLRPLLDDADYTLYIEKSGNKTYLVENRLMEYRVRGPFSHTDAVDPDRKMLEGQRSTPEGVYRVVQFTAFDEAHEVFGKGFYRIDYPNAQDLADGCTGSGVGICSAASDEVRLAIAGGRDVMHSGVALYGSSFDELRGIIGDGSTTQVVIEDYARRPLEGLR